MAVSSIGKLEQVRPSIAVGEAPQTEQRRRLELDRTSSFERASSTALGGFVSPVEPQTQAGISAFYAGLSAEQRPRLEAASLDLGQALLGAGSAGTGSPALEEATATALATYVTTTGAEDYARISQDFMYMAMSGMESQLRDFTDRLSQNMELGQDLRTSCTELRDMLSDWPEGETQSFSWTEVTYDDENNPLVVRHEDEALTKDDAEKLLTTLETQLAGVSDVSELAKLDLQQVYQDYQQAVQTLTSIQKTMHDDAMKIVANMKA